MLGVRLKDRLKVLPIATSAPPRLEFSGPGDPALAGYPGPVVRPGGKEDVELEEQDKRRAFSALEK